MKYLLLISLLVSSAYGGFPIVSIDDLSGTYANEQGSAQLKKAFYKISSVSISHEDMEVNFNKERKKLRIADSNTSVVLNFDFSFLNIFKTLTFDGVTARSKKRLFSIQSDFLNLFIKGTNYDIENLYVEADIREIPVPDEEDITIIDGLILNAVIQAKSLNFESKSQESFFSELKQENPEYSAEVNEHAAQAKKLPLIIRNLDLEIKKGQFNGRALMDSWINLWLRINGTISSNKDNSQLIIELDRAKLGIFSIKGLLLGRLDKLGLEGVRVEGRRIIVTLDSVTLRHNNAF